MNWMPAIYLAPEIPLPDLDELRQEVTRQTQVAESARSSFLNALKEMP